MPLTAKKAGLLLRSLEFRVKGYVPGTMRTILRKYGSTTALADKFIDIVRGYNDVVLDMGSIALETGRRIPALFRRLQQLLPALCPALLGHSKRLHRHRPRQRLLWRRHHPHLLRHRRAAGDLNHTEHIS